jgi:MFS family permease
MLMTYLSEFRINWQILLATFIGIATGNTLSHYTMSLFAPELIKEFGWTKAEFALIGALPMISLLTVPIAGRFTDKFGTRTAAFIGFGAMSLGFFAYSFMDGNISEFFAIWLLQHIVGVLTTSLVFTRAIVASFDKARGTALSALMMGAPISGAVAAPLLGWVIATEGWRTGFLTLAVVSALGGIICIAMMGWRRGGSRETAKAATEAPKLTRAELLAIVKRPAFLLIVGGMFLINIPQPFAASQIKLVVLSNGIADQAATWMVSLYAIGVMVGRVVFGLALDRISAHRVALFALSLPAIGFVILATPLAGFWMLASGILVIGIAQGAEGDVGGYMVSRHFSIRNYSLIFGFVKAALDAGGAIGALILSFTLRGTDNYAPFMWISAVATILGAIAFFLTGSGRSRAPVEAAAEAEALHGAPSS